MKKLLSLSVFALLGTMTASAQELLYRAKYHVYKVVLRGSKAPNAGTFQDIRTWNVNLLMATGRSRSTGKPRVLMFNATGEEYFLRAVGAPTYRITNLMEQPFTTHSADGVYEETYHFAHYGGQIVPPSQVVNGESFIPTLVWRSTVSGAKSLTLYWDKDEEVLDTRGKPYEQQGRYKLTFYCRPVE